jgi:hypothetical protein
MLIGPGQDLCLGQRQVALVATATALGQQGGQGGSSRQATAAAVQGMGHCAPGSPAASGIGPEVASGQRLVRRWWASAHTRICSIVNGGGVLRFRTPQRSSSKHRSDEPPGKPRLPLRRASLRFFHFSPLVPG